MEFFKIRASSALVVKRKVDPTYKRLRWASIHRYLYWYAGYYLVRKNFSLAMPYLVDMGFDKGLLGVAISANAIAMDCLSLLWVGFQTVVVPVNSCPWG